MLFERLTPIRFVISERKDVPVIPESSILPSPWRSGRSEALSRLGSGLRDSGLHLYIEQCGNIVGCGNVYTSLPCHVSTLVLLLSGVIS